MRDNSEGCELDLTECVRLYPRYSLISFLIRVFPDCKQMSLSLLLVGFDHFLNLFRIKFFNTFLLQQSLNLSLVTLRLHPRCEAKLQLMLTSSTRSDNYKLRIFHLLGNARFDK